MSVAAAIAVSVPAENEIAEPGREERLASASAVPATDNPARRILAALTRHRGRLTAAATLLVVAFLGKAALDVAADVEAGAAIVAFSATSRSAVAAAVAFTALSFAALAVYDLSALRHVGRRLPVGAVLRTSFCAYAVGNTAGFAALSGGAVRYRAYSRLGLPPEEIAAIVAFVAVAFGLGLASVVAAALLVAPAPVAAAMGLDPLASRLVAAAVLGLLALALVSGARRWSVAGFSFAAPSRALMLRQVAATAVDVAFAAGALYVLLPETPLGFAGFFAAFAVATGLGVLSNIPAGLGVFEAVIVAALGPSSDLETVLAALLVYRLVYHGLPLAIAILLLAEAEISCGFERIAALRLIGSREAATARLAAGLSGIAGLALLLPATSLLVEGVPLSPAAMANAAAGLVLVAGARGLDRRLARAWWCAAAAVLAGLALSLVAEASVRWADAAACLTLAAVVLPQRRIFARPSRRIGVASAVILLGAILAAIVVASPAGVAGLRPIGGLWLPMLISLSPAATLFVGAALATALALLLRPAASPEVSGNGDAPLVEALRIVEAQGAGDAQLVRMGDKGVLLSEDGSAFIMYARRGRSLIALFDPVGDPAAWPGLVWRFIETAKAAGCRPVFYQVSPALLATCADVGLRAFKLGEQALVDLVAFNMAGGKWASLRRATNRAERDGLAFEVIQPEAVAALMPDLAAVSDTWLAHHNVREKSFSLGSFDPAYLAAQPVAVLRLEGRIVAFASLLITDRRESAFIDLMRFVPGIHRGTMDLLFVKIIEHLKGEGYRTLNLGMAPLARMADRADAPLWNRVGQAVFEFGERLYNFKGLLAFKSKFEPDWQPRYLAVSGGLNPYWAMMDVAILIGGGLRGVFRK